MHLLLLSCAALFLLIPGPGLAIEPAEVAVVANRFLPESVELAGYYMDKRGIPKDNLIRINVSNNEVCSRKDFDNYIAAPVRKFLLNRQGQGQIRCLVTIFGVPLKVESPELTKLKKIELTKLQVELMALQEQQKRYVDPQGVEAKRKQQQVDTLQARIKAINNEDQSAAVDSELALVKVASYPLQGWVTNPYFIGFQQKKLSVTKDEVLMVARLDGPLAKVVQRIVDDSLAAEKTGLDGIAYFDARWPPPDKQKQLDGYAFYDNSLHLAAERIRSRGKMQVVVNDKLETFQAGDAPNAALYAGWYSLSQYVDVFDWVPGAVGFHIASGECVTLRPGSGKGWCKRMLEDGAAATVGPVAEPYLTAFPIAELFFPILIDGDYTLVEAYFQSLPYLSWQMILVGDPLYRPFKNNKTKSPVLPTLHN